MLQGYLDCREAQKFANLRENFIKVQNEFNNIHPGWEREESCSAVGPFSLEIYCRQQLYHTLDTRANAYERQEEIFNQYLKALDRTDTFSAVGIRPPYSGEQLFALGADLISRSVKDARCEMFVSSQESQQGFSLWCNDDASIFYCKEE